MPSRFLLLLVVGLAGCGPSNPEAKAPVIPKTVESPVTTTPLTTTPTIVVVKEKDEDKPKPSTPPLPVVKPTIFAARELAKVLDLGALPQIEGTKFDQKSPAHLTATAIGTIAEVAEFYRVQMAALGWETVPIPGVKITEDYGSLQFVKDGHIALLHMGKGFRREAKDPPKTSLNFVFHGNFDARTLPSRDGKMAPHSTPVMAIYTTENAVADEGEWASKALLESGWQEYSAFGAKLNVADKKTVLRSFRKQAYAMNVYVSKYGDKNSTHVNYTVRAVAHEIPAPPEAAQIEYDDENGKLRCEIPGELKAAAEFYQKAMPAAGYKPLPGKDPLPTFWNLHFGTATDDVMMVQLFNVKGEVTRVEVLRVPASVLAEMKKRETIPLKPKTTLPTPGPTTKPLFANDVPLPKDAKDIKRSASREEITFGIATDIATLTKQFREQLTAVGWQEEKSFAVVSKNAGVLNFKQAQATLRIVLVNTGLGDGTQATIQAKGLSWGK